MKNKINKGYMKKIAFTTLCVILSTWAIAQDVMVVKYTNGNSRLEEVSEISEISFTTAGEVEDNTPNDISRGLVAYYTFDKRNARDNQGEYHGFENSGSYILDTPNETGYALNLKQGEFISIGSAPLDGRTNYSISMWVKDFGSGPLLITKKDKNYTTPSVVVTEDVKFRFYTGYANYYNAFSADMSNYQSGKWTMVTIVCEPTGGYKEVKSTLYINGRKVDSGISGTINASGGTAMAIGGEASMKIDNVRLYNVTLSDDDVADIYNREKEKARLTITPQELFFDKKTSQLSFTVKNQTLNPMRFSVSDNLGILRMKPTEGYISPKGEQEVTISIDDRDHIDKFQKGYVSVLAEGAKNTIEIQIAKGKDVPESDIEVKRGLAAYYPFDNGDAKDAMPYEYDGTLNGGGFVDKTPNGEGKALLLKKGETMEIGSAPLDGKTNYSVSMWIKDFGAGSLLITKKDKNYTAPSVVVTEDVKFRFYTGYANYYNAFSADMSNYQSGKWTMVTIVCEPTGGYKEVKSTLYINGRKVDSGISGTTNASGGTAMIIGGDSPMKIDNIRLYSTTLTDNEVAEIYASETEKDE